MKNVLFTFLAVLLAMMLIGAGRAFYNSSPPVAQSEQQEVFACEPPADNIAVEENGKFISVLPGWGNHSYRISTGSDSAQFYFNQGLNFYYSYHFREALASFKETARFDKTSAMAYWGQALAMGPYYNEYFYKMPKEAPGVIKLMNSNLVTATGKEKSLITAMQQRYSDDLTNKDRKNLDSNYAVAMGALTKEFPADDDIKALYIDAVMLSHKWDFWFNDGSPKPWTPALMKTCQEIISRNPVHPAALHYFIHVSEASKRPGLALHSADVLKETLPGVAHMVHMATHMYQRNGLYPKGVYVNEDANNASNQTDSIIPHIGIGKNTNLHIFAVQSYCAMNAGMYAKGIPIYARARNRLLTLRAPSDKDAYAQYVYMMPVLAWVRLGKWDEILQSPTPDASWKYALALDNFAKGMAHVRGKNLAKATQCLGDLRATMHDSLLSVRLMPFNKPVQSIRIAEAILQGEFFFAEGKTTEAIAAFQQAVVEEDKLIYREPKDWLMPARQFLGACLLKMNMPVEAGKVFREDLVNNPGNGWSLFGMHRSLVMQKKAKEAAAYKAAFDKAWVAADVKLESSVF